MYVPLRNDYKTKFNKFGEFHDKISWGSCLRPFAKKDS